MLGKAGDLVAAPHLHPEVAGARGQHRFDGLLVDGPGMAVRLDLRVPADHQAGEMPTELRVSARAGIALRRHERLHGGQAAGPRLGHGRRHTAALQRLNAQGANPQCFAD
jgi:hypothetical protein